MSSFSSSSSSSSSTAKEGAPAAPTGWKAVAEDPRFKQGRVFLAEKNFEEAIAMFNSLLQSCQENYGESSVECAAAFFEYGNALLSKEEDCPSDALLSNADAGNADADATGGNGGKATTEEVFEELGDDEENAEGGEGCEEDEEEEEEEEDVDDLQIAYEVLEVARVTLSKLPDYKNSILLSDVHMRLGDLNKFNDNMDTAIAEYESALAIRQQCFEASERSLSDAHFSLAVAHVYNASLVANPVEEKRKALNHYVLSRQNIIAWLKSKTSDGQQSTADADQDLIDILQETIDALELEIKEDDAKSGSASSSHPPASTTTIGFGVVASGSSSSSSSSSSSAVNTSVLQVKRKRPQEASSEPSKK